jgi:hypothetical protein
MRVKIFTTLDLARVLVRFDHVARCIINANNSAREVLSKSSLTISEKPVSVGAASLIIRAARRRGKFTR